MPSSHSESDMLSPCRGERASTEILQDFLRRLRTCTRRKHLGQVRRSLLGRPQSRHRPARAARSLASCLFRRCRARCFGQRAVERAFLLQKIQRPRSRRSWRRSFWVSRCLVRQTVQLRRPAWASLQRQFLQSILNPFSPRPLFPAASSRPSRHRPSRRSSYPAARR